MTPPHKLLVYAPAGDARGAFRVLADHLRLSEVPVPGVIGPEKTVNGFREVWCDTDRCMARLAMKMRIYVLTKVAPVGQPPGGLRPAAVADQATIRNVRSSITGTGSRSNA